MVHALPTSSHSAPLGPAVALLFLAACSNSDAPQRITPNAAGKDSTAQLEPQKPRPRPADLSFTTPAGWQVEPPSNATKRLQFRLPRAEGDPEDAELWTTGPIGGTREANIDRWAGEFEQPDGRDSKAAAAISTRKLGDLEVLEFDVTGTYVAKPPPMSGAASPPTRKEKWRQIAVSIERGGDNHGFIRVRGPAATVTKWEASFRAFVDSAVVAK
ncbi:MAG: hypothetical protein HZA53_02210 [Planctomycetes bacterium]|nr:hypothetical protein [Planctomycetota bacterium]